MSQRAALVALALGLAITALFWVDPIFIPLALLGPLLTGALAAIRGLPLAWPLLVWLVAGLGAVVSDWLVNREDVAFHLVLTVVVVGLAALTWAITRRFRRSAVPATT
jgi:hypothetical protein